MRRQIFAEYTRLSPAPMLIYRVAGASNAETTLPGE